MDLAVVIPAFTRAHTLERLLLSLAAAEAPARVSLVIAVDRPITPAQRTGNAAVIELARRFPWPHGPKEVVIHTEHLGLVGNVFYAGGLAERFGAVVLLEDDLMVARQIFRYTNNAVAYYGKEPLLAGISLNSLWFNGFTHQPFIPLLDDGDVYFLQLSTPQGQAYTAAQWAAFAAWLAVSDRRVTSADGVHDLFTSFPSDDWLALKAKYLAATGRFYVYPRESLTTNFGEPGTHFSQSTNVFQVPLQHRRRAFRFLPLAEAVAVYDGFYEILPERLNRLTDALSSLTYDVDLYASKGEHQLSAEYTLTTRPARYPLAAFARALRPLEANVIAGVPGQGIVLARRANVDTGRAAAHTAQRDNDRYFDRRPAADREARLLAYWLRFWGRVR